MSMKKNEVSEKKHPYARHSTVPIETVMAAIEGPETQAPINGQLVGVSSLRLRTFREKGIVCVGCGLTASHFAVERNHADDRRGKPYHLNLYGVRDGEEILFTHDHILARSLGGLDVMDNTQTMCAPCNSKKSQTERRADR